MRKVFSLVLASLLALVLVGGPAQSKRKGRTPAWGGSESPLRPGAQLGSRCTFNFAFYEPGSKGKAPKAYIGTAGHCTTEIGEEVTTPGLGPVGKVVYDSDLVESTVDFSLVELYPRVVPQTSPEVLGWGGPTGVITPDELAVGDQVDVYGYGLGVGNFQQTRPRSGVLMSWTDEEYQANMPAVNGDSGAPLLHHDTGMALGIISRYGITFPPSTDQGPLVVWVLEELSEAGFDVELATI